MNNLTAGSTGSSSCTGGASPAAPDDSRLSEMEPTAESPSAMIFGSTLSEVSPWTGGGSSVFLGSLASDEGPTNTAEFGSRSTTGTDCPAESEGPIATVPDAEVGTW